MKKIGMNSDNNEELKGMLRAYIELVEQELSNKNCLIIASADVNPLTEIVLAKAYNPKGEIEDLTKVCFPKEYPKKDDKEIPLIYDYQRIVFALKNKLSDNNSNFNEENEKKGVLKRFFSRKIIPESERGFMVDNREMCEPYYSQDHPDPKDFSVLGHLIVMRNPFSKDKNNIIVLLNAVSGPGTFGLAEVLTGGDEQKKEDKSEEILEIINRKWKELKEESVGIEAIIEVKIQTKSEEEGKERSDENSESISIVKDKFYDPRKVISWNFYVPEGRKITLGNPREIIL
jgi:hypothetical protein